MRFQIGPRAWGRRAVGQPSGAQAEAGKTGPLAGPNGLGLAVWLALAVVWLALAGQPVGCQEQLSVESRQQKPADFADTLQYLEKLEKLDKYWSEIARPRFGRSKYKQALGPAERGQWREPAQLGSLAELISSRLAQKYNSNAPY